MSCECRKCLIERADLVRLRNMIVCESCGNKRCPHAENHDFECTRSNEPGQIGVPRAAIRSAEGREVK